MVVSVCLCMGVFVTSGVCMCMCDCVIVLYLIFLSVMQNKLNITKTLGRTVHSDLRTSRLEQTSDSINNAELSLNRFSRQLRTFYFHGATYRRD